jgi:hypothetical protein
MSGWREGDQRHLVGGCLSWLERCLVGGESIGDVWLERGGSGGLVCVEGSEEEGDQGRKDVCGGISCMGGGGGQRLQALQRKTLIILALRHNQDTHCAYWTVFSFFIFYVLHAQCMCIVHCAKYKNRHNEFGVIL